MKTKMLVASLVLGLGLALALLVLLARPASPAMAQGPNILYVAPGGDCGGATPCYDNIQKAVDAADSGDEILVASGVYTGINGYGGGAQMVYISKTVTIRGGYTTTNWIIPNAETNHTTLDAQEQGRVLYLTGNISPTIEGLQITGGNASGLGGEPHWGENAGGGVYVVTATVTISNCTISGNAAEWGGGAFVLNATATFAGNVIGSNWVFNPGGGLYLWGSRVVLANNVISGNTAQIGGGGGAWFYRSNAVLNRNLILSNTSPAGGGLGFGESSGHITNTVFVANIGYNGGDELFIYKSPLSLVHSTLVGAKTTTVSTITSSQSNDYDAYGTRAANIQTTVTSTSSKTPSGVGVCVIRGQSIVSFTNTVISGFDIPIADPYNDAGPISMSHTLWNDVQNIDPDIVREDDVYGDPCFTADGYHIGPGSAAIDAGVDAGVYVDIDGDSRPIGTAPDIGADEYCPPIYLPIILRNFP